MLVDIELTLIIPTFNEESIIEDSLVEIVKALGPQLSNHTEIIIADDGSDSLNNLIPGLGKRFPFYSVEYFRNIPPLGKGASIARAIKAARGEIVGFLDADLSTSPKYILKAIEALGSKDVDVFIGSRKAQGAAVNRKQFFIKDILGKTFYFVVYGIFFFGARKFKDTQCGFKFFKNQSAKILFRDLVAQDGLTDLEILLRANLLNMGVVEWGVDWVDLRESKRSLKRILVGEILSMATLLFNYKILAHRQLKQLKKP